MLAAHGAEVIAADEIGHEVLEPGTEAAWAVAAAWPEAVVDGRLDRRRLAGIVFSDPAALEVLEALTHPHIAARIRRRAADAGGRVVAVEIPLLVDILGEDWPRLVVLAEPGVRRARAVGRGMDPDDVARRMAAQPSEDEWVESATWVVRNDGTRDELGRAVDAWWAANVG
jgi:dephospho-CoA kinase